jgi:GxxExxY protein
VAWARRGFSRIFSEFFTTEGTECHRGNRSKSGYSRYYRRSDEGTFRAWSRIVGECVRSGLVHELRKAGFKVEQQVELPVNYDGIRIDLGYRIDLVVNDCVIVELKCVEKIAPVHEAQLISYMRLSKKNVGLLINFHVRHLKDGIKRFVEGTDWN